MRHPLDAASHHCHEFGIIDGPRLVERAFARLFRRQTRFVVDPPAARYSLRIHFKKFLCENAMIAFAGGRAVLVPLEIVEGDKRKDSHRVCERHLSLVVFPSRVG